MNREQLIAAQEREFPGSRILTHMEVRDRWLVSWDRSSYDRSAAPSIALALLQHPVIVFYEYGSHRGARYGLEGSQYISGFGRD